MTDRVSDLAQKLRPYWLRDVGSGGAVLSGSGSGGMVAHAINGPFHVGTLDEDQAPWAVTDDELAAHAALADVHHAQAHVLATNAGLGADHSISGATAGHVLRASNATAAAFAQLQHGDLGGVTANQHHNQVHNIVGTDHTLAAAQYQLVGATGADTLGLLTPSSNPGAAVAILRSDMAGALALTKLSTPSLDTLAGSMTIAPVSDLLLNPGSSLVKLQSGISLQSHDYASQATGMRVTAAGEGDFRYIFADELHAKSFIADLEQALAGGQIISKSVALLAVDFVLPAAGATGTLRLRDLPSAPNMAVFQSGDFVGLRQFSRSGGSLTIGWAWGTVTAYADQPDGTQTWTFTRHATTPGAATGTIYADSLALDFGVSGNGFYEVNAIDGAYALNSPYWRIVTWDTHPATQTVRVQGGNLRGLFSQPNEFGFYAGNGTGTSSSYLRLSSVASEFRNLSTAWYSGSSPFLNINATDGIEIASSAAGQADQRAITFYDGTDTISGLWASHVAGGQLDVTLGAGYGATTRTAVVSLIAAGGTNRREINLNANGASISILHTAAGANTVSISGSSGVSINGNKVNGSSGAWFNSIPVIGNDGVMEVGRYIDFHAANGGPEDFHVRLQANTNNALNITGSIDLSGWLIVRGNFATSGTVSSSGGYLSGNVHSFRDAGNTAYQTVFTGLINTYGSAAGLTVMNRSNNATNNWTIYNPNGYFHFYFEGGAVGAGSKASIDYNGVGYFGTYLAIGTNVAFGYYQDSNHGAYRANDVTGDRAYYFQTYNGSATRLYVGLTGTYAARVGINTQAPAATLDVVGSIYGQGNFTLDGVQFIKTAAQPPNFANYIAIWFDGTSLRARLPGGTTRTFSWVIP